MSAQDIILGSRVEHVRELKTQVSRLAQENAELKSELESLKSHFGQALMAALELRHGMQLELWDGWNLILGAHKEAASPEDLLVQAQSRVAADPARHTRVWIVYDGPVENVTNDGLVRVSYTGGTGPHRADRFICDFLRMAVYLGHAESVSVRTNDKEFFKTCSRLKQQKA